MKNKILIVLIMFFSFSGCKTAKPVFLSGKTMGTTWSVLIAEKAEILPGNLQELIVKRLDEINNSMSLFIKESQLSEFNRMKSSDDLICVSDDFMEVFTLGENLYKITDGAWDGSTGPLVTLWGFGNREGFFSVPDEDIVEQARGYVGYDKIRRAGKGCLSKDVPELVLDFGSVAKGYGVDAVSKLLKKENTINFIVEIGGEVYASGTRFGKKWRVAIGWPSRSLKEKKILRTVTLKDRAVATSGDYNNFFEIDGQYYSHIIDPEKGWPVKNSVAAVSVTAKTTAFADGLATAVMVMGVNKGLALVNSLDNVECLIVRRESDGSFTPFYSEGFCK